MIAVVFCALIVVIGDDFDVFRHVIAFSEEILGMW
jgi:hypothetical protein